MGLIFIMASLLFGYQQVYAGKIYKNVYVANIDLSGKTKSQAAALLQKKYDSIINQDIVLKTSDKEVKTKVADTGLTLDVNKIISESYQVGRNASFTKQLASSVKTLWERRTVKVEPKIDQDKLKKFMDIAVAQLNYPPQDASIVIENGEIKQAEGKDGQTVDTSDLAEKILEMTDESSSQVIPLKTVAAPALIKLANFGTAKAQAETILNKKINLTYEDKAYSPTKNDIGLWIKFQNNNGQFSALLNDGNIQAYLNKIAKNFEITKADRKINALDNSVIEEGREGKYLDKNNALSQIKSQMNGSGTASVAMITYAVAPAEVKVFPAEGVVPGRFEGRYVDIDLTNQKLCRVEATAVIDCFLISSGKPGMATPAGTFYINDKNPRHWSGKYSMWLPYWQQFISGGWGIHELPETNTWKETAEHLGTPVSHGCVRLGVGPAQTVYDWTSMGTPVYVHK